ncbi:MAG: SMC-Scp complex subunit ScpB [Acidaminococcaceae bacterium]|jgi:segregation and condensation protein B|nr:SMC-Scp complex subunit ScpB [Acidaminococcaceae bacterium]MCI2110241.1 SMC-Scp complex subunit ScpB [Acidaminococcaceae bacterium]
MVETHLLGHLEALLFASGDPLPPDKIAAALELSPEELGELVTALEEEYKKETRGLHIRRVAGGLQLVTKPELINTVHKLIALQETKLSNAAMETLAIIAFKQPVTRSEMEAIRGVKVDGIVNNLLEMGLIMEAGRKDAIGHPILYGTTDLFLTTFGLDTLHDLPEIPGEILAPKNSEVQEGALFSQEGDVLESSLEGTKTDEPVTVKKEESTDKTTPES